MIWQTSRRKLSLERPLVMAILNVTPDSFSDGGELRTIDDILRKAERLVNEGADILDIGGESTRPGSVRVPDEVELSRAIPAIEAIVARFDVPVSIDTYKSAVAERALAAGAEIVNDISGLRFDPRIADVTAAAGAGLVLMHSRGTFETMHSEPPVDDIFAEVSKDLGRAIAAATVAGVPAGNIALDIGIGFGKTFDQNLELIAGLGRLADEFAGFPILVGTSRKSFIGKILSGAAADHRLNGSLASAALAVWNGAAIVRVHDVAATVEALSVVKAIRDRR